MLLLMLIIRNSLLMETFLCLYFLQIGLLHYFTCLFLSERKLFFTRILVCCTLNATARVLTSHYTVCVFITKHVHFSPDWLHKAGSTLYVLSVVTSHTGSAYLRAKLAELSFTILSSSHPVLFFP